MSLGSYLKNMILVMCMGKLGSLELAAGSLAIGFTNITGYSVLSGLAAGMEPLCAQAFGSRNFSLLCLTLHRTILMLLLASLPISLLWLKLEPLMLSLHQNPDITSVASLYCRYALPDLIANSFLHPIRIYLRSKGTTWPLLWCTSLSTLIHIPIIIFFTFKLQLGVPGIAISSFIANFNTLFFLLLYMSYPRTTNSAAASTIKAPLTLCKPLVMNNNDDDNYRSSGSEWGKLLRFSIQSCVGVCLEWWWYELMTILAGYMKNPRAALATSGIIIQTTSLLYALPNALSAASSTRVGNELGAGEPRRARLSSMVALGLAAASSTVGLVWTTVGKERWGRVFSSDREVLELTMTVLPIIGLCEIGNCPQTTGCGILRGSARTGIGAGINLYAFYLAGAPVGIVLGFVWQLGLVGMCYGLLAAQIACVVSILVVVYRTDWERESLKAKSLVGENYSAEDQNSDEQQIVKCDQQSVVVTVVQENDSELHN
ncbi:hypothetical protein QN277_026793 [Acacia crassicarpa]|uniref:Protein DETOXIFICATION n=1 Tax=Acacia crassicarpa TaxID=499986 RepID=A0AAE1JB24_9FABA|nr:hypothetical protein QN277_026793 [Acacia crassicarpa]